jgi:hypothetical protein
MGNFSTWAENKVEGLIPKLLTSTTLMDNTIITIMQSLNEYGIMV